MTSEDHRVALRSCRPRPRSAARRSGHREPVFGNLCDSHQSSSTMRLVHAQYSRWAPTPSDVTNARPVWRAREWSGSRGVVVVVRHDHEINQGIARRERGRLEALGARAATATRASQTGSVSTEASISMSTVEWPSQWRAAAAGFVPQVSSGSSTQRPRGTALAAAENSRASAWPRWDRASRDDRCTLRNDRPPERRGLHPIEPRALRFCAQRLHVE